MVSQPPENSPEILTDKTNAMRFFPFKIAILCLLLTPALYIATLTTCRQALEKSYLQKIQNTFIGNADALLNGRVPIEEQIAKNIQAFLDQDFLVKKTGLDLEIRITTAKGRIVFPTYVGTDFFSGTPEVHYDAQAIADKNFGLLNEGLQVTVSLSLGHGSKFANLILALYSFISFSVFWVFYRIGSRQANRDREAQRSLINDLKKDEKRREKMVNTLSHERRELFEKIRVLNEKYQTDKHKAKINEDEMFREILSLEEQLNTFIELKNSKEEEISELKSALEKYERRKSGKSRRNEFDFMSKRFAALYKHLDMHRKALDGFMELSDDHQIKAEETVHLLDRDPDAVIVKRKVFSGKKHKTACFEVLFAYNGRLYFRKDNNRTEIVVIGTKNSQHKDMEFLQSL